MRFALLAILLTVLVTEFRLSAADQKWEESDGHRWAPLEVGPDSNRGGFTRLASSATGVSFINRLSEQQIAENRVLANGSGVAIGDYDKDGMVDLFFCGLNAPNVLYRNLGNWQFEDVTIAAGLVFPQGQYRGAVFADVDGDRQLDLLVGTLDQGVLCFRNTGNGQFVDTTSMSGTASSSASTTLALADVDANGTLDLYVVNNRPNDIRDLGELNLKVRNQEVIIPPHLIDRIVYEHGQVIEYGQPDQLFLNNGHGQFKEVDWTSGTFLDADGEPLKKAPRDWGLTGTFRDINDDGLADIYVCNDYWTPDRIWINQGQGVFRAIREAALLKTSASSMGIDFGDVNGDGHTDFLVLDMLSRDVAARKRQRPAGMPPTEFLQSVSRRPQVMRNTFFAGEGGAEFSEMAWYAGLAASEWSWSPIFTDVDLDGREDLLISAGHYKDVQDVDAGLEISRRQGGRKGIGDPKARQKAFTQDIVVNSRIYPPLDLPIVAFRNMGDFRFEDMTGRWGTDELGVHHGIAMGDLDGDGDLDLVANNLNGVAGIYRNEGTRDRIAVRLHGNAPNTQAIGALVILESKGLPSQRREVVSGGRYTSGSDTLLSFAADASDDTMSMSIRWPGGNVSTIASLKTNRIYDITEPLPAEGLNPNLVATPGSNGAPLFARVPDLGEWSHAETPFDDFSIQPLLPFRLSHSGPGVGWVDAERGEGARLVVGSGRGGDLGVFHFRDGRFEPAGDLGGATSSDDLTGVAIFANSLTGAGLLVGVSNYENRNAGGIESLAFDNGSAPERSRIEGRIDGAGAIAIADIDGDGWLEMAVAGQAPPGRYPLANVTRVYRSRSGNWIEDASLTIGLPPANLPNGMVFSDIDGDGLPELVIACEWGPIRVFKYQDRRMHEVTSNWGLDEWTGLWKGVTAGDFNGDGRMDIVATNWGENTPLRASAEKPLVMVHGEMASPGIVDLLETEYLPESGALTASRSLPEIAMAMPFLLTQFTSFRQFSESGLDRVLGERKILTRMSAVNCLASSVFINQGDEFKAHALPIEAQMAPAFGVTVADFNGDNREDLFVAQNFQFVRPGWNPMDAGRGLVMLGDGQGQFTAMDFRDSGVSIAGDQRGVASGDFDGDGRVDLAVGVNSQPPAVFRNHSSGRGIRLKLIGNDTNPLAIGSVFRVWVDGDWGPSREVHSGSGYWSQDSLVQVIHLGGDSSEFKIQIRLVNGNVTEREVVADTRSVMVDLRD